MIGKATLKAYQWESIDEYFNYIVESEINGQHKQKRELYKKLSKEQKEDFFKWLKINAVAFDLTGLLI